jgi:hypothetical protein
MFVSKKQKNSMKNSFKHSAKKGQLSSTYRVFLLPFRDEPKASQMLGKYCTTELNPQLLK